ncbi:hypothetical protein CW707_03710 [Candidatus Bathyarchaeota archaeon]|nr:MAG: hypothetical protein CW667_01315 [Candidatus Bathyarchaeota archaeon]RJS81352.1 MAG: hypothetical protein CW707_03710 [Candidatus Bathyarchaeota archaeon]RLI18655.1 MAG: hypothetical protein DRO44_00555 [Candidatus Bathyarchaeota archaeon]
MANSKRQANTNFLHGNREIQGRNKASSKLKRLKMPFFRIISEFIIRFLRKSLKATYYGILKNV